MVSQDLWTPRGWGRDALSDLLREARQSIRSLARSATFTAAAICLLAVGIGASATVFSVVNAIYFRPLPYPSADRLASLSIALRAPGCDQRCVRSPTMSELALWDGRMASADAIGMIRADEQIGVVDGASTVLEGAIITRAIPDLLGLRALRGRSLLAADFASGADRVLVLSHGAWLSEFGGDPAIVGKVMTLGSVNYHIVGILDPASALGPPLFSFNVNEAQYAAPTVDATSGTSGQVLVRWKADASRARMAAEVDAFLARSTVTPGTLTWRASVVPLHDVLADRYRSSFVVLLGAVGVVLLVMCMNVAGLLLARLSDKLPQFATRALLGANRFQLIRPIAIETMSIAIAGGAGGLLVAAYGVRLARLIPPDRLPFWTPVLIDSRVIAIAFGLAVVGGLALSCAPLGILSPSRITSGIRDLVSSSPARARMRGVIVAGEIALSVMLLTAAAVLTRQLVAAERRDLGVARHSVVYLSVAPKRQTGAIENTSQWAAEIIDRVRTVPNVLGVAVTGRLGASARNSLAASSGVGRSTAQIVVEGRESQPLEGMRLATTAVTPASFVTRGTRLVAGRDFTDLDGPSADPVAILDQSSASRIFGAERVLGRRFRIDLESSTTGWLTVVGVGADVRSNPLAANEAPRPILYRPMAQVSAAPTSIVVRIRDNTAAPVELIRSAIRAADPATSIASVYTAEQGFDARMWTARFNTRVLVSFAVLAVVLACVGIYATVSYLVSARRRELAIRIALGATEREIVLNVMRSASLMLGIGVAVGVAGSIATARVLRSLLYGAAEVDPLVLACVIVAIGAAGYAATFVPARHASRTNPSLALRGD